MVTAEWVFPWRRTGESRWHRAWPVLVTVGAFVFALSFLRIRVEPPTPWAARRASVIHVAGDAQGRALTLRAREGGPFPSRFEPSEWEGARAMEQQALQEIRWPAPPYVPNLRNLPDDGFASPLRLSTRGALVLPISSRLAKVALPPGKLKLAPALEALSGISAAEMPGQLPVFDGAVDATMTAESWRFLLRLDASGKVLDCVSMAGGDEAGPSPLVAWLRRVSFSPEPGKSSRWLVVGVEFTNQPDDGPDAR